MFQRPRYVFKAGELIVLDGRVINTPTGATHVVKPDYDRSIERTVNDYFSRFMTVRPQNLRVSAEEIVGEDRGRLIVHPTQRSA
jgi:formylmethanofuran dehydrogenase subunit A